LPSAFLPHLGDLNPRELLLYGRKGCTLYGRDDEGGRPDLREGVLVV
jgi:hypothetical protein